MDLTALQRPYSELMDEAKKEKLTPIWDSFGRVFQAEISATLMLNTVTVFGHIPLIKLPLFKVKEYVPTTQLLHNNSVVVIAEDKNGITIIAINDIHNSFVECSRWSWSK